MYQEIQPLTHKSEIMASSTATLPVGPRQNFENKTLRKGDKILLVNGDEGVFVSMNRTRFTANVNGSSISVPIARRFRRDPMTGEKIVVEPFVVKVIGFDSSSEVVEAKPNELKLGDFFYLEGKKELYCLEGFKSSKLLARAVVSNRSYRIPTSFTFVKWSPEDFRKEIMGVHYTP